MKLYIFIFIFLIILGLHSEEYLYEYKDLPELRRAHYNVTGQANLQYKVLEFILPIEEDLVSVEIYNPSYKTSQKHIALYLGDASISQGFIANQVNNLSAQFPTSTQVTFSNYLKRGIKIALIKIPHQIYRYASKELDILDDGLIKITTSVNSPKDRNYDFLTNESDFNKITKGKILPKRVKEAYLSSYLRPSSSVRNTLNIDPAEMLIISPATLLDSWSLYADYKSSLGRESQVVNISNIISSYSGRDNAEKLRNFLIEVYSEWSSNDIPLTYVILGGDYNLVPSRQLRIRAAYNSAWHSNNIYSDLYFSALDGDWDNDGDNLFGEGDASQDVQATGSNGEEADLYGEIYVGRIPVENSDELENWINKQTDYESNQVSEQFFEKVLLLGEYLGSSVYGGPAMNEVANYLADYSLETLYSQNGTFSESGLTNAINNNLSQVHHLGHGSSSAVFSIDNNDITNNFINQDYPFIYTQGCHTANFSVNDAIGESFILNQRGAFAYIGNTSYGFYSSFENQGPSQLFHREFVDAFTNENHTSLGIIHMDGKEDLVGITDQTGTRRYVYFDNVLLADPSTSLIQDSEKVRVEQVSDNAIRLSFSSTMSDQALNIANYRIFQRDNPSINYPLESISQLANAYYLNFTNDLPAGIPLRISIENISNLLNPTLKLVEPLYTIKESSIITPTIWLAEESPIYVYKHQIINSNLTIEAGTEVRINSGKSFYIYWGGEIRVEGDSLNYVTFTSYSDDPNQDDKWTDITIMMDPSPNSYVNYAMIKNSQSGIWLDSLSTISLNHVRFRDNQDYGIYAKYSNIQANYLEFSAMINSQTGALRIIGGNANLNHLTSAENGGWELIVTDSANVNITNSIIWGQSFLDSEFISIDYSILPTVEAGTNNLSLDPLFISSSNLRLQPNSPAINSGDSSELDPDDTITDRGFWYYHYPNSFSAQVLADSSPKQIQFTNLSLGDYDSIEWDFNNDGLWDSSQINPQHTYLTEGTFSIKMRLTKDTFQQDILLSDLIDQTFNPLLINFPLSISKQADAMQVTWQEVPNSDLYKITSATDINSPFTPLLIQAENTFIRQVGQNPREFYQVQALEQIINIAD
jgi:hypothetical protein